MTRPTYPRRAFAIACGALAALLAAGVPAAEREIHRWVDENGVTHFSDVRPPGATTEAVAVPDAPPVPAAAQATAADVADEAAPSAAEQRRRALRERRAEAAEQREEAAFWCDKHRTRLEQMEPARRVFYTDENGEQVRMDDDQRMGLIEESKAYLAGNCQ